MIERQYIISKSGELFKQQGLKNTTMDDIASSIGISKKTLYQNICDRNELIEAVIMSEYYNLESKLKQAVNTSKNYIDQLIKINVTVLDFLRHINPSSVVELSKHYPNLHQAAKDKFSALIVSLLKNNLIQGKEVQLYQKDIDVDVIVGIHSDRLDTMQKSNNLFEAKQSAPETIKQMITYYIRGLVTPQGQELLDKHIIAFDKYIE